jgi:hypothetical protein
VTRLPELERQLLVAARAREQRRRRWWRISLLGAGATFALVGVAGAVSFLLPEGDPVPQAPPEQRESLPEMDPGSSRLVSVRADDPEGGLPWGLAIARSTSGHTFCAQVGRVQNQRLGVIGRDGTFTDDGKFHPLSAGANQSGICGGVGTGDLQLAGDGPPIPASGFTGSFLSAAGGCRENVPANTMSPQTRRKLRDVPVCKDSSLRVVKYGFAGREATNIEYGGKTLTPDPRESGAYLFVLTPRNHPLTLKITYRDGTVCRSTYPTTMRRIPRPCP